MIDIVLAFSLRSDGCAALDGDQARTRLERLERRRR